MAITEQQFIDAYKGLTPEKQNELYNRVNEEGKTWINNYNASLNNQQGNMGGWNYGDDSADRQEQIVANLNDAYQQDPSKFSDWNTFSQNFNYDYEGRSDKEKETMRNWYEYQMQQNGGMDYNNPNNTDYFLGQLMNGQTLQGQGTAATNAYNRYKDYQSLSGMTPEQIASAITNNSINPVGQSMIDLKNYSPSLYAQVQGLLQNQTTVDDINSIGTGIYEGLTKTETNSNYTRYNFTDEYAKNASVIKQYNESLYKKIEGLGGDTAAYVAIVASMLQNPLIQANKDEIENIEGEIRKVQDNIWTIGDTARSILGSEAPEDLVSAYISQQTKALQTQLRTLNNSLLVAQGKLDNQLSEVDALIDAINQGINIYGTGTTGTTTNNYQYINGSKYQEAGYFDKSTGQFYRLGETPDTYDYQSSDPARLQEIADNLVNIANSSDVYVFRDRSAFNDYFKYNQRSAAQKAVLDEFWNANASILKEPAQKARQEYQRRQAAQASSGGGRKSSGGSSSGGSSSGGGNGGGSDLTSAIKSALMNGVVNFSSTNMKKTFGKYGVSSWDEDTTNDYLQEIGKISSVDEIAKMLTHLTKESNKKALVTPLKSKVVAELKAITGLNKSKKQKEKLQEYATKLGIPAKTLATWWGLTA